MQALFQSTRPLRGATVVALPLAGSWEFQSTRPLRGATALARHALPPMSLFQSTRPLRGATVWPIHPIFPGLFQSTRPLRGATNLSVFFRAHDYISIHAPLAGRDA